LRAAGFDFAAAFGADPAASEVADAVSLADDEPAVSGATVSTTRSAAVDFVARGVVVRGFGVVVRPPVLAPPSSSAAVGFDAAGFDPVDFAAAVLAAAVFAAAAFAAVDLAAVVFEAVDFAGVRLAAGFGAAPSGASSASVAPAFAGAAVLVRADPDRAAVVRLGAGPGSVGVAAASLLPISGSTDAPRSADTPVPVPSGVSSPGPDRETEVTTTTYQVGSSAPPNPLHAAPDVAPDETERPLGITSRIRHDVARG
jgi:hypothetical protein